MSVPRSMPVARSSFVNVLGWIFVCLTVIAMPIGTLQNVMFPWLFSPDMHQPWATQPLPPDMPATMGWAFTHLIWFFRGFLLLSALALVAAIGLLLRREWARRLFIALMVVGIACALLGLVAQWRLLGAVQHTVSLRTGVYPQFAHGVRGFMVAIQVTSTIIAVGVSVLFGWIIKRLLSAGIRQEFRPTPSPPLVSGHRE